MKKLAVVAIMIFFVAGLLCNNAFAKEYKIGYVDLAKVSAFRNARFAARSRCDGCWVRFICCEGCCASDPRLGVVLDAWGECTFQKSFVEIAIRTLLIWRVITSAGKCTITEPRIAVPVLVGHAVRYPHLAE